MADVEWQPLPALWPEPAVWTDVGELMLLVFTQDGVPTWEVSRRAEAGSSRDDLIANGTADAHRQPTPIDSPQHLRSFSSASLTLSTATAVAPQSPPKSRGD